MKHQLHTEITINADLKTVWSIFSDFENYPNWNPFIKSIKGEIKVGERFEAEIGTFTFKPTVKVYIQEEELTWLGRLFIPGIFDGRHSFTFSENEDGTTTLIHGEKFSGILVPFMKKKLNTDVKEGFESMNEKLKELAEKA
ncbi:MAG: SRPBCC domain-containing protein [Crocinitomicaceae bacterium]|nr:SRPBCC domain-containing protein [Crocinitomicaceae bacterium]